MVEELPRRGSCASSESTICSVQSVLSCVPSHSLMIAGPDGSLRVVEKTKQTMWSECGCMHMIQETPQEADKRPTEGKTAATVLPVEV